MLEYKRMGLDQVFHALADPTRRTMVGYLAIRSRTVGELAEPFAISLAAVSKHIKVLENAGLVRRRVKGRVHTCILETAPLAEAQNWLNFYQPFSADRLAALEAALLQNAQQKEDVIDA